MSEPFLGEIRIMGFSFAPRGWAVCNGALQAIAQNTALFSLFGTNFGGNGITTFGLPNLNGGCTVVGAGQGPGLTPRSVGETGGEPAVTLDQTNVPSHEHAMMATASTGDVSSPGPTVALARSTGGTVYGPASGSPSQLNAQALGPATAGGQPHNNLMPYQVLNYCVALQGIFPQRP